MQVPKYHEWMKDPYLQGGHIDIRDWLLIVRNDSK